MIDDDEVNLHQWGKRLSDGGVHGVTAHEGAEGGSPSPRGFSVTGPLAIKPLADRSPRV